MADNSIYSKIDYQSAYNAKKESLEIQKGLLETLRNLTNYKNLRKKELVQKIRLRNTLKTVRKDINKLLKELPQVEDVSEVKVSKKKPSKTQIKKKFQIESELKDIQKRLEELS